MHIFGVTRQCAFRNLKWSTCAWPAKSTLPEILIPSCFVSTPWNWIPVAVAIDSTPLSPRKKSKCHQERRNSPSVASLSPTSSCFRTIFSISRSSTARSAASLICFLACFARASLSGAVRSRLPTWSAPNRGLARCSTPRPPAGLLAPDLLRELDHLAHLRPLLLLGQHIALLGRGEAALRAERHLLHRHELGRLVEPALHGVLALQRAALGGDDA